MKATSLFAKLDIFFCQLVTLPLAGGVFCHRNSVLLRLDSEVVAKRNGTSHLPCDPALGLPCPSCYFRRLTTGSQCVESLSRRDFLGIPLPLHPYTSAVVRAETTSYPTMYVAPFPAVLVHMVKPTSF